MTKKMLTEETTTHRRCKQTQCQYFQQGGCKECQKCNAENYVINKTCRTCFECENKPGELRWSDEKTKKQQEIQQLITMTKIIHERVNQLLKEEEENIIMATPK
jgi:hypothetical protein